VLQALSAIAIFCDVVGGLVVEVHAEHHTQL
jgi:hypothetical protein